MTRGPSPKVTSALPENPTHAPGDGIRSLKTSGVFRAVNFELYARPVIIYEIQSFYLISTSSLMLLKKFEVIYH